MNGGQYTTRPDGGRGTEAAAQRAAPDAAADTALVCEILDDGDGGGDGRRKTFVVQR